MAGVGKSAAIHTLSRGSLLADAASMRVGLACLLLITGCDLYFTDGDDTQCALGALAPAEPFRNPETGECIPMGFGGCDDPCGQCAEPAVAPPDWGSCVAGCEAFGEASCVQQPGCRAVYDANSLTDEGPRFLECWAIAPSGPVAGSCQGLDAQACSQHENCSAFYDDDRGFLEYSDCRPEKTDVCATADCAPNTHCEAQCTDAFCSPACIPNSDQCATMDCSPTTVCVETCAPDPTGCDICSAQCVPVGMCESVTSEAACVARTDCAAVYTGDNCVCNAAGVCQCDVLEFARCQAN